MLDCERQAMKSLSKEQLIYLVPTEWCKSTRKCPHFNDDDVSFWLYADIDDVMDYIKAKNNVTNT